MASNKKKYGLILASARRAEELRSAAGGGGVRKINVLRTSDDELEEDDPQQEEERQHSGRKTRGEGNSAQQAQQLRLMREALEEDPSIFMYDEHYDDLKARQTTVQAKKQQSSEPKYIGRILQSAQRRQLERERCTLRKLHKEREAEQGIFDDKESFVTPAYVKKLEEIRQAEAREKIMEVVEEKNEAMRDRSTGLFYKEIFNQRLGGDEAAEAGPGPTWGQSSADSTSPRQPPAGDRGAEMSPARRSKSVSPGSKRIKRKPNEEDAGKSTSYRKNSRSHGCPKRSCDDSPVFNRNSQRSNCEFKKLGRDSEKLNNNGKNQEKDSSKVATESNGSNHAAQEHHNKRNSDRPLGGSHKSLSSKYMSCATGTKSPSRRDCESVKKEIASSPESAAKAPSNSENVKEEAETKEDRVARLFAKRTVGTKFIEAQQRYLQRKEERSSARGGL